MGKPKTLVAAMLRERLKALGIGEGKLRPWAIENRLQYQRVWNNVTGNCVSKDNFIAKLATRLGIDPVFAVLTAHADRVTEPYQGYFLAARQRYVEAPLMEKGWANLDTQTRAVIIEIVSDPDEARRVAAAREAIRRR